MQIPEWWQNPDVIPFDRLQHDPEYLDAHAAAIDKHCEQLLVAAPCERKLAAVP